jgi:hypothetical protein
MVQRMQGKEVVFPMNTLRGRILLPHQFSDCNYFSPSLSLLFLLVHTRTAPNLLTDRCNASPECVIILSPAFLLVHTHGQHQICLRIAATLLQNVPLFSYQDDIRVFVCVKYTDLLTDLYNASPERVITLRSGRH